MVKVCRIRGCKNESYAGTPISFHRFPKDVNLKRKWENVAPGKITKWTVVCGAHFKCDDFIFRKSRKMLRPHAVPSIFPEKNLLKAKSSINHKSKHDRFKVSPKMSSVYRDIVNENTNEQLKDDTVQPSQQVNEETYDVTILEEFKEEDIEDPLTILSKMSPDDIEVEDLTHKEFEEDLIEPTPFKKKKVEEVEKTPLQSQLPLIGMASMGQPFTLSRVEPTVLVWSSKLQAMEPTQRLLAEKAINDVLFQGLLKKLGNGGSVDYKG